MRDNKFKEIVGGKPDPEIETDDAEDLGSFAAIAKSKWITSLTIRHAENPWESLLFSYMGVHAVFEPTPFAIDFVGHDESYRIIVTGRDLHRFCNLILQGRLE